MQNLLILAGRGAGILGVVVAVIAVAARLAGNFNIAGIWVGTLLQGAMAAVVIGCFLLLWSMTARR